MSARKTKAEFISESRSIHGNKYDYSKVEYINANTKVCIICPIHGEFWQRPNDHLHGIGCKKCAYAIKSKNSRMNFTTFVDKARIVHGDKYKYNKDSFHGSHFDLTIICPIHGDFVQRAERHINGQGCPKCSLLKKHSIIQGTAINDTEVNTKTEISYRMWHNLINRALNAKVKKKIPTYKDVSVCKEWLTYSNFKTWFDNPENGYIDGYELDKDILVKGNKIYSPQTCCFVPHEINTLLINRKRFRGKYPIGVSKSNSGKYKATVNVRNTRIVIGTFNTTEEAFNAYKRAKETIIKSIAKEYYDNRLIKKNVYDALNAYNIEIND